MVGSTADSQPSGGTGALAGEAATAAAACSATLPGRAVGGGDGAHDVSCRDELSYRERVAE